MRILKACPYSWHAHGGVQEHIAQAARALRRRGHTVAVVTPGEGEQAVDDCVTVVGRPVRLRFNGSVAPSCLERTALDRVRRHIEAFAPDVVHTHEPFSSMVSGAAARYASVPVLATFHCALDGWHHRLVYRGFTRALWWLERTIDIRLAVSSAAADTVRLATSKPVGIVPNGVELEQFAAAAAGPIPADGAILFVGRLEPRKGLATLLEAMVRLWRRRPGVRLTVVGAGRERRLIERLPPALRSRVDLHERCSRDELVRHYAAARIFVAPSRGGESFGMVLLDALAAGRPVVASDIGPYRDLLDHGRVGLLAAPGDAAAFADRLGWLLDHPDDAASFGRAAVERARDFTWEAVAAHLEHVYLSATEGVSARSWSPGRPGADADGRPYGAR